MCHVHIGQARAQSLVDIKLSALKSVEPDSTLRHQER